MDPSTVSFDFFFPSDGLDMYCYTTLIGRIRKVSSNMDFFFFILFIMNGSVLVLELSAGAFYTEHDLALD